MYLGSIQIDPSCHSLRAGRATSKCLFSGDEVEPVVPEQQPDLVHDLGGRGHPQQGPALAELETKVTIKDRAHICHKYHQIYLWRKNCHVEKFQLSIQNLNNLWSFIEVYAVFVPNLREEKFVRRKSVWRKNDK